MWNPELFSGSALIAGATAYVVAIPLVLRKVPAGFSLSVTAALLASIVVVGDNFSIFGSTPNLATYWLNWAFFVVQVPLVWWSLAALWRAASSASLPAPGPGLPGSEANEGSNRGP